MAAQQSHEITIAELLDYIQLWFRFLLSKWKTIVLYGILGGCIGLTYALLTPKKYVAELNFALEEKGGSASPYAAIASQFGVDLGGGNGGAFTGENLVGLLHSRMMIEKTLLSEVEFNGKRDLLINRYIEYNELRLKWEKKESLRNIKFTVGVPRNQYSTTQDSIVNGIQNQISKAQLSIKKVDKKLNLVQVLFTSQDELFAKVFTEKLVAEASLFYIETKTKKSRKNIELLELRIDSVRAELDNRLLSAAVAKDQNANPARALVGIPYTKKQIDIQLLTTVYAELSKNLELAKFTLMKEEPLVQVIDSPILPLRVEKPGKLTSIILFGFVFGVIHIIWIVLKKFVRDSSAEKTLN